MKDTDVVARYKTMHETLVYLCHLDHEDTEAQMLEKLRVHVSCLLHLKSLLWLHPHILHDHACDNDACHVHIA